MWGQMEETAIFSPGRSSLWTQSCQCPYLRCQSPESWKVSRRCLGHPVCGYCAAALADKTSVASTQLHGLNVELHSQMNIVIEESHFLFYVWIWWSWVLQEKYDLSVSLTNGNKKNSIKMVTGRTAYCLWCWNLVSFLEKRWIIWSWSLLRNIF